VRAKRVGSIHIDHFRAGTPPSQRIPLADGRNDKALFLHISSRRDDARISQLSVRVPGARSLAGFGRTPRQAALLPPEEMCRRGRPGSVGCGALLGFDGVDQGVQRRRVNRAGAVDDAFLDPGEGVIDWDRAHESGAGQLLVDEVFSLLRSP
jgi:hypothetical protein